MSVSRNPARSRPLSRNVKRLMKMARESPQNPNVSKIEREFTERDLAYCDMQGSIFMEAAMKAVTTVDESVKRLIEAIKEAGGMAIVTADHGNADVMIAEDGSPMTAHSLNPVPFILVDDRYKGRKLMDGGVLADITPTLLDVMGIAQPAEMTGHSLIEHK